MIKPQHFQASINRTLQKLGAYDSRMATEASVQILLGTAAQESDLGYFLTQDPAGPGRGPYQIEQPTHLDVIRYIERSDKEGLLWIVEDLVPAGSTLGDEWLLVDNLAYSHAIARIRYWMVPEAMPEAGDIEGLGRYWKRHYNTIKGKGTVDEFVDSWEKFVVREGI